MTAEALQVVAERAVGAVSSCDRLQNHSPSGSHPGAAFPLPGLLPGRLNLSRWTPAPLLAGRVHLLMSSRFGRIDLAGHASVARDEMRSLAADLPRLADGRADGDLRALLTEI